MISKFSADKKNELWLCESLASAFLCPRKHMERACMHFSSFLNRWHVNFSLSSDRRHEIWFRDTSFFDFGRWRNSSRDTLSRVVRTKSKKKQTRQKRKSKKSGERRMWKIDFVSVSKLLRKNSWDSLSSFAMKALLSGGVGSFWWKTRKLL